MKDLLKDLHQDFLRVLHKVEDFDRKLQNIAKENEAFKKKIRKSLVLV
jgi:hypothetical protein